MKIAIINISGSGISGGYKKYLFEMIPRLINHNGVEEILCIYPMAWSMASWFTNLKNVYFLAHDIHPILPLKRNSLKSAINNFKPDVIFVPTERYFRSGNIPVVNMVQNMEPFVDLQIDYILKTKVKLKIQNFFGKIAVRNSDGLIALSSFVRTVLSKEIGIKKTSLIYHGVNQPDSDGKKPINLPKNLNKDFIFTAGSILPARGLEDLILALRFLKLDNNNHKLVIAGHSIIKSNKYYKHLLKLINKYDLKNSIFWTGPINEDEMRWCFQNSKIFVMTSRVESFGLIAVEAMANGCVCISTDSQCLPEIFDSAAFFYKSGNYKNLASLIRANIKLDSSKVTAIAKKAVKRSLDFSWDICANKTISFLHRVASK